MTRGSDRLQRSMIFWVAVLYLAEGFPLGVFYDIFPVHFRQQGVDLRKIGLLSLLGLSWTLKFLWAPAVDRFRHHRRWMCAVDLAMGSVLVFLAIRSGFGPETWVAIGLFTAFSATNDIAIDGYTVELLDKRQLGLANGFRIGFYRVGMLAAGVLLMLKDHVGWKGAYFGGAVLVAILGIVSLTAPRERFVSVRHDVSASTELQTLFRKPTFMGPVVGLLLGALWLTNNVTKWSEGHRLFWPIALGTGAFFVLVSLIGYRTTKHAVGEKSPEGPVFGALMELLRRPHIAPVILFILTFKLADTAMGFMVKPFWVDAGFSAGQIGLVSVNLGLFLSIAGGIVGGKFTDRFGIFRSLWVLGLTQAVSNLGYAAAALLVTKPVEGAVHTLQDKAILYSASGIESFTQGLGTGAFLAFLMAIVSKRNAATEYALLSSVFALSRSVSGWLGGYGAQALTYAPYFLLTFFLAFPAYALLPWVRRSLDVAAARDASEAAAAEP